MKSINPKNAVFKYYDDQTLIFSRYTTNQVYNIETDSNNLKMVVVSDTHFGSSKENREYCDFVGNYAINNGIKYVINVGDVVEGFANPRDSIDEQIDYVINGYMCDTRIKNLLLLGNHDASVLLNGVHDLEDALNEEKRLTVLGYKCAHLKVANQYIKLRHQINRMLNDFVDYKSFIALYGHTHKFCLKKRESGLSTVKVPTLSDVSPNKSDEIDSGFIVLDFQIENNEITDYTIEVIDFKRNKSVKKELKLLYR